MNKAFDNQILILLEEAVPRRRRTTGITKTDKLTDLGLDSLTMALLISQFCDFARIDVASISQYDWRLVVTVEDLQLAASALVEKKLVLHE